MKENILVAIFVGFEDPTVPITRSLAACSFKSPANLQPDRCYVTPGRASDWLGSRSSRPRFEIGEEGRPGSKHSCHNVLIEI